MRLLTSSFCRWFGTTLFLMVLSQGAVAQGVGELTMVRQPSAVDCLVLQEGATDKPVYPPDELRMKERAKVRAQLTFEGPGAPPRVKIVENTGAREFGESVKDFVARYRLPCMRTDVALVLVNQEFSFDPSDGRKVFYGPAEDAQCLPLRSTCVTLGQEKIPSYPREALQRGAAGNVIARVKFERQDAQPDVDIVYDAGNRDLARSVRTYVEGYRYVCPLTDGQAPVAEQSFRFRIEDGTRYAFKDVKLPEFLAMVDPKGLSNAKFDLTKMGCPFDLSVRTFRPYARNRVGEIGSADGSRKPFIDWLEGLTVTLPRKAEPYLIGEDIKVSVPCLVLDL